MSKLHLQVFICTITLFAFLLGCNDVNRVPSAVSIPASQGSNDQRINVNNEKYTINFPFTKLDIISRVPMLWPANEDRWIELDAGSVDSSDVNTRWCVHAVRDHVTSAQCGTGRQPRFSARGVRWQPRLGVLAEAGVPTILRLFREDEQVQILQVPAAVNRRLPEPANVDTCRQLAMGMSVMVSEETAGDHVVFWITLSPTLAQDVRGCGGTIKLTNGYVSTMPIEFWTRGGLAGKLWDN